MRRIAIWIVPIVVSPLLSRPAFSRDCPGELYEHEAAAWSDADAARATKLRYGYIDINGRMVIKPQFERALAFSEGLAAVGIGCPPDPEGGAGKICKKVGFINRNGAFAIPLRDDLMLSIFRQGRAVMERAYIDRRGRAAFQIPMVDDSDDYAASFHEGLARVRLGKSDPTIKGYVDARGRVRIKTVAEALGDFSEGLAWIERSSADQALSKHCDATVPFGFIDKRGKLVIKVAYCEARPFSQGLAAVKLPSTKWGFIDKTGRIRISARFDGAGSFRQGRAPVRVGERWGYVDRNGMMIIKPSFACVEACSEGRCAVANGKRRWGFVALDGSWVIKPTFSSVRSFSAGRAAVRVGPRWGYIDRGGRLAIRLKYLVASSFSQGLAAVK